MQQLGIVYIIFMVCLIGLILIAFAFAVSFAKSRRKEKNYRLLTKGIELEEEV